MITDKLPIIRLVFELWIVAKQDMTKAEIFLAIFTLIFAFSSNIFVYGASTDPIEGNIFVLGFF